MTLSIYTTHFDHDDALAFTVVAESEDDARAMIKDEYAGQFGAPDENLGMVESGLIEAFSKAVDAATIERFNFERQIVSWAYNSNLD